MAWQEPGPYWPQRLCQEISMTHHCKAPPFWCTCCFQHTVTSSRTSKQIPLQATSNSSIVCHKTHCSTTASCSDVLPFLQPLDPIILAQWQPHPPSHPLPTQHSSQNSLAPLAMMTSHPPRSHLQLQPPPSPLNFNYLPLSEYVQQTPREKKNASLCC